MAQTVRIDSRTHDILKQLSNDRGQPMTELLAEAVEELRREDLLRRTNQAYARLREDPKAWAEEMREREAWEVTLADGLDDDQ